MDGHWGLLWCILSLPGFPPWVPGFWVRIDFGAYLPQSLVSTQTSQARSLTQDLCPLPCKVTSRSGQLGWVFLDFVVWTLYRWLSIQETHWKFCIDYPRICIQIEITKIQERHTGSVHFAWPVTNYPMFFHCHIFWETFLHNVTDVWIFPNISVYFQSTI